MSEATASDENVRDRYRRRSILESKRAKSICPDIDRGAIGTDFIEIRTDLTTADSAIDIDLYQWIGKTTGVARKTITIDIPAYRLR